MSAEDSTHSPIHLLPSHAALPAHMRAGVLLIVKADFPLFLTVREALESDPISLLQVHHYLILYAHIIFSPQTSIGCYRLLRPVLSSGYTVLDKACK